MLAFGTLMGLILFIAILLSLGAHYLTGNQTELIEKINRCLPQTQCGQCGYPGCRPYACAIAQNNEAINRCPPGGENTIQALAYMLQRPILPLNPELDETKPAQVAVIDEEKCIGCTLCLPACPVDAIVGAQHCLHTVLKSDCTGCELCIAPCPVDCISMQADATKDLVPPSRQTINTASSLPCVRCDSCTAVCPVGLPAQALYHEALHQRSSELLQQANQCIECGLCEKTCPSHIPLLDYYRWSKAFTNHLMRLDAFYEHNLRLSAAKQKRESQEERLQQDFWNKQQQQLKQKLLASSKTDNTDHAGTQ